jgi:hypothetical protein
MSSVLYCRNLKTIKAKAGIQNLILILLGHFSSLKEKCERPVRKLDQSRRGVIKNMAGTFSQIYIQVEFAIQDREILLQKPWREEVFSYMAGITMGKNQKPIIINGVSDHVHLIIWKSCKNLK